MHARIVKNLSILLSIIVLQVPLLTPPECAEDIYSTGLIITIKVRPTYCLTINKETIEKILAEYTGPLRGIALREYAKQRVAQFRLTKAEGQTYIELLSPED